MKTSQDPRHLDRIFGIPLNYIPRESRRPQVLKEDLLLKYQGTEGSLPTLTVQIVDQDQLNVTTYSHGTPKTTTLLREQVTRAALDVELPYPRLRRFFGITRRVEWQPYAISPAPRNPNH